MLEEEDVTLRAEEPAVVGATQAAAAAAAPMTSGAPALGEPAGDEGLFGEEADFFDFADELNKELGVGEEGVTEVSRGGDHQMTLEQIVSGIQSGVAKQVDPADYETHYNLGIAYKEMGLQDEAIGEFQYASKDPAKFLQCCILLGACFTEKGMPELAIKWYEKGRATPTATEDDHLALGYEIAACREALGEDAEALKGYMEIFATNARYRDVGAHVASLKQKLGR
jgi:tetratricopeptide (TPR) repeat protein